MTTLKITSRNVSESLLVRCNLAEASNPVEVDYQTGNGWSQTRWTAADMRHRTDELAMLGGELLAMELSDSDIGLTEYQEID